MLGPLLLLALAQDTPTRFSLVFGGDVIPHGPVKYVAHFHERGDEAGDGWDQVFGPLVPVLRRNDAAVVNLEAPVSGQERPRRGANVFDAPPQMLAGLKRAGVTVASFANNHCLDQGPQGIASTRAQLAEAGLKAVGAAGTEAEAWQPLVLEKHGFTVGLLAMTRWRNGLRNGQGAAQPHVPTAPYARDPETGGRSRAQVAALVRAEAAKVDALIVSMHWGVEDESRPLREDRALAVALVEAGALAVVGHHPHVLQPVEWITRKDGTRGLVAFSLGNLVSNQSASDAAGLQRDGLLLELELEKSPSGVALARVNGVALATENRAGRGRARSVQPVLLEDEMATLQERLEALAPRDDLASRAEQRALGRRLSVARTRLKRIRALLGPAAEPLQALAPSAPKAALLSPVGQ
jgi:Bacterial capsule synthesis protein PGA_cap